MYDSDTSASGAFQLKLSTHRLYCNQKDVSYQILKRLVNIYLEKIIKIVSIRALIWPLLTCPVSGIMFSAEVSIHNLWGLAVSLQFSKFLISFCKVFGGEGPHKAREVRLYLRLTWGQLKNIREMIRLSQLSGSSYPSNFFALGATQWF